MKRIAARTLLGFTTEQLWDILQGDFVLVFDDGELTTNAKETLYSSYAWDFHREYGQTPMLTKHHVQKILNGKHLNADTHLELLGSVMWSVHDHYLSIDPALAVPEAALIFRDKLAEKIYRLTNAMYNDLTYRLEEYVVSLDITDFIEVLNQPDIKRANDSLEPSQRSIDEAYKVINDVLKDGVSLPRNPISRAVRAGTVKMGQVLQSVGPRGYLTDTDSNLFRVPVLRGYVQGLRLFYDSLVESRSAAKSLIFSKTPLQQAEYFSRRLQLMSQIVQNLHHCDCGSTEYVRWKLKGDELKLLAGKNYLDDAGNLRVLKASDKHLVGKTLKLRSVLHCAHPDPYGICSTCFGELSLSVPANTNIGQMCCTSLAQQSSQNVLSVKHLDGSSVVEGISLNEYERNFLKVASDENSYLLADSLRNKAVHLVIPADRASNITDIMEVKEVEDLNITRVSELEAIGIRLGNDPSVQPVAVRVDLSRRLASMTYPLLKYIRANGWGVDDKGNYTIDMKNWDWSKPILTLPLKHFNMSDHSRDIASLLESSVEKLQERDSTASADAILEELYRLVNSKLVVNLAVLEVVLYGSMVVSVENGDYSLPKPWTTREPGVMKLSMANRSLSAAMAFENHREVIVSPTSFVQTNRPEHPFDGILMPAEVFSPKVNVPISSQFGV